MSEHYFTTSPQAPARYRQLHLTIRGREHTVTTASGVFSGGRLDKATQVLLDHVPDPPAGATVLDLGCGWGALALALADAAPDAEVLATDVNERALELTAANAAAAGHTHVRTLRPEELVTELTRTGRRLDVIWSNPPVRIGKDALHDLLTQWLGLLADDGEAWFVVGRNLGADSLAAWLEQEGYVVRRAASSKGFRVLQVRRTSV